ncbi:MAG: alpha/beta fold hydrolase [Jatrophihabitans sp.]|nr:MAG: alpha/beta fold hydrolase [Jatrophihabitans sp.]
MAAVHYVEQGEGPTLLCLHGIGSSSGSFARQLDGLADAHRVVAWDAPGYGKSADPEMAPGLPGYADAVVGLIATLGGERVHLLGVSWGGVLACQVALDHPELLRSLILVDASVGSGRTPASAAAMRARPGDLAAQGPEAYARERAPRLLSSAADADLVGEVNATMAHSLRLPGYRYAAEAMAATDLTGRLAQIAVPTLVLCGDEDTVTGPEQSWVLASGIRDAVYVSVRGAGHQANIERPEAINAWVASFIQIIERLYR